MIPARFLALSILFLAAPPAVTAGTADDPVVMEAFADANVISLGVLSGAGANADATVDGEVGPGCIIK